MYLSYQYVKYQNIFFSPYSCQEDSCGQITDTPQVDDTILLSTSLAVSNPSRCVHLKQKTKNKQENRAVSGSSVNKCT